ncbi:MAG TPA: DUF3455 domain-containing protein [Bryobacteraceae bacterium]|nr:DUF3455 domain-containing protein [Bryobacteraceae bacterium]
MNQFTHRLTMKLARGGMPIAALLAGCLYVTVNPAAAQSIATPATPTLITPPVGNTAFLVGHASGTQGYVCLPTNTGASWTVNSARPEATLFTSLFGLDVQIITHFLSPDTHPNGVVDPVPFGSATWQSSLDSSKVWAQVLNNTAIGAGTDPSCPNTGSIACLLLQSIGSQQGPTGGRALTQVSFIQRLNTKGGSAPAEGCSLAGDVGKQALVPYTADYYFFHAGR